MRFKKITENNYVLGEYVDAHALKHATLIEGAKSAQWRDLTGLLTTTKC